MVEERNSCILVTGRLQQVRALPSKSWSLPFSRALDSTAIECVVELVKCIHCGLYTSSAPLNDDPRPGMVLTRRKERLASSKAEFSGHERMTKVQTSQATTRKSATRKRSHETMTSEGSDYSGGEGSDWEESSKRRTKRIKKSYKRPATKHKSQKGIGSVLSLPLDVQLEIFSWMSVKDLVSLCHTNKELRQTLLNRSAGRTWALARELEDVPEPSLGMSEPQWAALLFDGVRCSVIGSPVDPIENISDAQFQECGAHNIQNVDFGIRRRLCVGCKQVNLVWEGKFKTEHPEYDEILLEMISYTHYGGWGDGRRSKRRFFWLQDIHDIAKQWAILQDAIYRRVPGARQAADSFLRERKQLVTSIHKEIEKYTKWYHGWLRNRAVAIQDLFKHRREAIYKRFIDMGYTFRDVDSIRDTREVYQSRPLTERIWKRIRPALEARIQERRQSRMVWSRKKLFERNFKNYLKTLPPREWLCHPDLSQVLELPAIKALVNAEWDVEVTTANLEALLPSLPEAIGCWRGQIKAELTERVLRHHREWKERVASSDEFATKPVPACEEASGSKANCLNLATTVLSCSICPTYQDFQGQFYASPWFGWEGALRHSCHTFWSYLAGSKPGKMDFNVTGFAIAAELVKDMGLDPDMATVEDMDKTGVKWFCQICTTGTDAVYDWKSAIAHALSEPDHVNVPNIWRKLTEHQLAHVQNLDIGISHQRLWGCGRCDINFDIRDSLDQVVRHLEEVHQIEELVEGETVIRFFDRHRFDAPYEQCLVPPEPPQSSQVS